MRVAYTAFLLMVGSMCLIQKVQAATIYYLWGGLEPTEITRQFTQALPAIQQLRSQGFQVRVDLKVTQDHLQKYLNRAETQAIFWSSHGDPSTGLLWVWCKDASEPGCNPAYGQKILNPGDVQRPMELNPLGVVNLCACYSGMQGELYAKSFHVTLDRIYTAPQGVDHDWCIEQAQSGFPQLLRQILPTP